LLVIEGPWAEVRALEATSSMLRSMHAPNRTIFSQVAYGQGETHDAWMHIRTLLPNGPATVPGDGMFLDRCHMQRLAAVLAIDAGDLSAAREWLEAHDRWLIWSDAVLGRSEGQLGWSKYHRAAGDSQRADDHAQRALLHASEPRQPLALLAAHRLLGELGTDAGKYAEAATHLAESLSLADACAAPYERALTLLALAALQIVAQKRTEAQASLDEVRAICTPLGAKPALARADALAAKLTTGTKAVPTHPAGLSAREVEVLRLVAEGLTNAQVAERLYLSSHTINSHLTMIYNKLGVASRSAAIRFALENDLT
jgi:DNA-binding NarL/FixJ family response regulator